MRIRAALVLLSLAPGLALGCGWWGDGEKDGSSDAQAVDADGNPVSVQDPMQDPLLMVRYGDRFRTGEGAPRDLNLAHHWYRLAAERGYAGGQYNLALLHENGIGVIRDEPQAVYWYRLAALQGDVHAQHHIGRMYLDGRGVARDEARGVHWFEKAAARGHAEVFVLLAQAYAEGRGVTRDDFTAYQWFWLAAQRGDAAALRRCTELARELGETITAAAVVAARLREVAWQ
jgi:TPR repeat protein